MKEIIDIIDILEKIAIVLGFFVWGVVYLGAIHIVVVANQPYYLAKISFYIIWTLIWGSIGISTIFYFESKNPAKKFI